MSPFTQSALLKALGWSLLNSMWQMALLWLLYLLLTALANVFYKKKSAGLHHTLAILILGAGSAWSGISFIRYMIMSGVSPQGSQPILSARGLLFGNRPESSFFLRTAGAFMDQALPLLSCLYLGVLFFLMIRYIYRYRQSGLLRHCGLHKAHPELRLFVDKTRRGLGIHKKVSLWLSSFVEAPLTIGFLKPLILLPVAILNNLDLKQVEAILVHELAHIKKNDYLLNLLIKVVETLFFFNPFAKLLIQSITKEREHRCDDLVVQFRYDPHSYASALLLLAGSSQDRPQLAMAATGWDDRLLLQRVKRIMKLKSSGDHSLKKPALFLLLAALAALPVLFQSQAPGLPGRTPGYPTKPLPQANTSTIAATNITAVTNNTTATAGSPVKSLRNYTERRVSIVYNRVLPPGKTLNPSRKPASLVSPISQATAVILTVKPERRDFSIVGPIDPIRPRAGIFQGQPFVPPSSFSYQLTTDDNSFRNFSSGQIEQALQILAAIDWNKIEKKLSESGRFNVQNLPWMKMQVLQKLLELSAVYRGAQPDIKEIQKKKDSLGRPLIIIHI